MELSVNQLWRQGPEWLCINTNPPSTSEELPMPEECLVELKAKSAQSLNLLSTDETCSISGLIDSHRYSSLMRLSWVTAQVLRAVKKFRDLSKCQPNSPVTVTKDQITSAELLWIKNTQRVLTNGKDFEVQRKQFDLFLDERGVWRCGGRLSNAEVTFDVKHPIILPRSDHFSVLVVQQAHERVFHNGVRETLTEVRRKFLIPKARSLARQVVHRCILCKKLEGMPYKPPPLPPFPAFRVTEHPGFTYTGVDFAGRPLDCA